MSILFTRLRILGFYLFLLTISNQVVPADLKDDIGYTRLLAELNISGQTVPTGAGVPVLMAEACANSMDDDNDPMTPPVCLAWLPDSADPQLSGVTIVDRTGSTSGLFSFHATGVARLFFGTNSSIAPGITQTDAYLAEHWLNSGFLHTGNSSALPLIGSNRVANHSWIGTAGTTADAQLINSDILRRVDWLIEQDEMIISAGLNNSGTNQALLSSAYNIIAAGRSDGGHARDTSAVDSIYTAGRTRPHLVAPLSTTSSATAVIASAATLLIEIGHNNTSLSTDPESTHTNNRVGNTIYNAERAEVVKAILMTGADRHTISTNISDYRLLTANQTANGLDRRFGAGQVNIANSYNILNAGEQNSAEDQSASTAVINSFGFDYDPSFGGSNSNSTASYQFSTSDEKQSLYAALAWNLLIDTGLNNQFDGTATLFDLNLELYDITETQTLVAESSSENNNTENLWAHLQANREYLLKVTSAGHQAAFNHDYALAWRREPDSDHDGVGNQFDNCIQTSNPTQRNSDSDPFGNRCDADFNNNGVVDPFDFSLLKSRFGSTNSPDQDLNGNGVVDPFDFSLLKSMFGAAPGPSGLE